VQDKYLQKAKSIISQIAYINLATVTEDGYPWNSPLFSVHDDNFNFYWISDKSAVHSKNITNNKKAFITIYDSTALERLGEGVYMQTLAYELDDASTNEVVKNIEQISALKEYLEKPRIKLYKAVIQEAWFVPQDVDKRIKIVLR